MDAVTLAAANAAAAKRYQPTVPKFSGRSLVMADRVTQPFDILGLGDSLLSGQGVSSRAARWPNRMIDRLRLRYPTPGVVGGEGYVPSMLTHGSTFTLSGNTASSNSTGLGRQGKTLAATTGSGAGSASITVTCSSFKLHFNRFGNDAFTITIDGGAATTITAGPLGLWSWTSPALTPGSHTVVVTETAGGPELHGIMVFNGDETKGIRYWDGAQSGTRADQFNATDVGGSAVWANNIGTTVVPDLVIVGWMTNDYINRTPAQYQASLGYIRDLVRSKTTAPILWLAPYERVAAGFGGATWSQYVAAMRTVAASDSASNFFNVADYVPRLSPDTFGALVDGTHPTDKFAAYLGDVLAHYIGTTWVAAA